MTAALDPRRHPVRADLAASHLKGRVTAERYADGAPHRVAVGRTAMHGMPDRCARLVSEAVYGEGFTVYESRDGWAWGQNQRDGYVGWVRADSLAAGAPLPATHVVGDLRAFVSPEPDLKVPPVDALALGTRCAVVGEHGPYCRLADGGWVSARHLRPVGWREPDPVATGLRLVGVPYLWGGRTPWGIDCSGLVQLAAHAAGRDCPRDSDMQREELGAPVVLDGTRKGFARGDIVFFPGHVGLMLDETHLLHATAFTMTVTVEPLAEVVPRTDPTRGGGILAVRRLDPCPA